jgi:VWFA-related protein
MRPKVVALLMVSLLLLPVRAQQPGTQNRPQTPNPLPQRPEPDPQKKSPQTIDQDDVVRITTNVVQIDAVVTKDGKQVTDLKAEDFEIFEDKKPQKITNFSYVSNISTSSENVVTTSPNKDRNAAPIAPVVVRAGDPHRTMAIVVDDLGIAFESIGRVRNQLRKFVEQDMRPNDLVAIIRTGGEVGALQQFTTDKRLLLRAIENLRWNISSRLGVSMLPPVGLDIHPPLSSNIQYPIMDTLQAIRFILNGMREMPGRKSMLILSDSLPVESEVLSLPSTPIRAAIPSEDRSESDPWPTEMYGNNLALQRVAELAIRASVVIYAANTAGLLPTGITAADNFNVNLRPTGSQPFNTLSMRSHILQNASSGLDVLTRRTGGFLTKNSNNFGIKRVAEDQNGYYLIGYRPASETFNRRFHNIKVRVKRSGLSVRTRSGFFGMTDEDAMPIQYTARDQIALALMSPFGASDIEVHLSAVFANLPQRGSLIRSLIHFPASAITFTNEPDGWHKAILNLSCIVFGDNGGVVQQLSETREVRLRAESFDQIIRDGLTYQYDVPLKKHGSYQFRVAVRDAGSARIGTAREFIDVPELKKNQMVLSGITLSGYADSKGSANDAPLAFNQLSNPALRRFKSGTNLLFGYAIYNARVDKQANTPNLSTQTKIFRDGNVVYEGPLKPIDVAAQKDMEHLAAGGGVQLGTALEPGEYLLQVIVTEPSVKEKRRTATRWIDFEIVK